MSRYASLCVLGSILGLLALPVLPARAQTGPPSAKSLPAFTLVDLTGSELTSETLVQTDRWVLAYIAPDCAPCGPVLEGLAKTKAGADVVKVAVVVRGDVAQARALRERHPALAQARWFADARREGSRALRLAGVPAVLGWRGHDEAWRAQGASLAGRVDSLVDSWLMR